MKCFDSRQHLTLRASAELLVDERKFRLSRAGLLFSDLCPTRIRFDGDAELRRASVSRVFYVVDEATLDSGQFKGVKEI